MHGDSYWRVAAPHAGCLERQFTPGERPAGDEKTAKKWRAGIDGFFCVSQCLLTASGSISWPAFFGIGENVRPAASRDR